MSFEKRPCGYRYCVGSEHLCVAHPFAGDVVHGRTLGKRVNHKHIYAACADCGKYRWTELRRKVAGRVHCSVCGGVAAGKALTGHIAWNKGLHGWWSDDHVRNHLNAIVGRTLSLAHRAKISVASSGRHLSDDTRQHISESRYRIKDNALLLKLYLGDKLSCTTVGAILGCSVSAVQRRLCYLGVTIRSGAHYSRGRKRGLYTDERRSRMRRGWELRKSSAEHAEWCAKVSQREKDRWDKFTDTERRERAEFLRNIVTEWRQSGGTTDNWGVNNSNWRGGLSFEPYPPEFDDRLKYVIRARDGFRCKLCGVPERSDRNLDVHHIDYNKSNCATDNLISLCHRCHIGTFDCDTSWIALFRSILSSVVEVAGAL